MHVTLRVARDDVSPEHRARAIGLRTEVRKEESAGPVALFDARATSR